MIEEYDNDGMHRTRYGLGNLSEHLYHYRNGIPEGETEWSIVNNTMLYLDLMIETIESGGMLIPVPLATAPDSE